MKPHLVQEIEDKMSEGNGALIGAWIALMFVYQFVTLASWRFPSASRAGLGLQASLIVFFSFIAFGGLYLLVGKKLNPSMLQVLPLLSMGLGMDDMFVFIRYFSQMGVEFVSSSFPLTTSLPCA